VKPGVGVLGDCLCIHRTVEEGSDNVSAVRGPLNPVAGVVSSANVTRGMRWASMVGELSAYPHVAGSFSRFWLFGARNVVRHCDGRPLLMVAVSFFLTCWFRRD